MKHRQAVHLEQVAFEDLKHWEYDEQLDALSTFQQSCKVMVKRNPDKYVSKFTSLGGKIKEWFPVCNHVLQQKFKDNLEARQFFERWFVPYKVYDHMHRDIGKFTGYYEIELNGSKKKSKKFKYPIYATPADIKKFKGKSSFTHASINKGILSGRNLELAYTDNLARLFFMHIQGSGVVKLEDGKELKLGYHNQNGHSYKAVGPLVRKHCRAKIASLSEMMEWLHKNPILGRKIMEENPSYVFFRPTGNEGPIGGQGVPLTAERSIAIDASLYPYGAPIWVETTTPKTYSFPSMAYNRLFIAQDTGGAIKGAIRADIFYGRGGIAEELAWNMNHEGSYYILLPKNLKIPASYQ